MKITNVQPFILHTPVTRDEIADSSHQISHWGAPGLIIETDAGLRGYGFTGTHAHMTTDRMIVDCIVSAYAPLLLGEDPREVRYLWQRLQRHSPVMWVGRTGIIQMALAAVDVALWDLKAKAADMPLWKLLGGSAAKRIMSYNTDAGWLNWPLEQLVDDTRRLVEEDGYSGVKVKVGRPHLREDLERLAAVRETIGPDILLMVDANGRFDLPAAIRLGRHLPDYDVLWFEEPIWHDDLEGHRRLAESIETPIALGELLYTTDDFRNFIHASAVHYVQADAIRLAGISEWWQVADLAHAYRLPVVPHAGDMAQIHLQVAIAHPACTMVEYIPWLQPAMEQPVQIRGGYYVAPQEAGAGTTVSAEGLEKYNVL